MATDHRTKLAGIKTLSQLIAYLRDEMNWPIAQDSFEDVEDLFYDFTADELGIDPKTAAKIESIKRLRPLSVHQPWGIFFVKFEPKKLPVVALRRILGQVALKKRPSANSVERTAWAADDLLFISNYGEGSERQISFAHFAKALDGHNLPTLKVLGWDNLDTAMHLDAVAKELTEHLSWPADDTDVETWRKDWRGAFTLRHGEVVSTSKQLSIRLAGLARDIRDRINSALDFETDRGPLTKLMKAFQTSLVHDLKPADFADMYAQTIAYGLLSARIADPHKKTVDDFAGHMRTNPFLRELMETFLKVGGRRGKAGGPGIDFDELGVNEVVELLDDANMEAVVRDFGDKNPLEDPVIHFYELFLKEYDAKKRMQRGVFYTPRPVVSYILRSVDELLRTEFGLEDGLADTSTWGEMAKRHSGLNVPAGISPDQPFVQILDPATGTGTFLVEVIDIIHKVMVTKWTVQGQGEKKIVSLWNEYVPKNLLPRLHAYELLMAPYAIAHLKVGLKLYETGYSFGSEERARIYLTNALEPAQDSSGTFKFAIPALAHEAQAVNEIKKSQRFTVVVGNPPYAGVSSNMSSAAQALVDDYKMVDGQPLNERKVWLQDDYVKFIRLAQMTIDSTSCGVIGFITNHAYLDNPTFRGMRQSLLGTFPLLRILDLHGNSSRSERPPDGSEDKNVFDIQQGVAIALGVRLTSGSGPQHAHLWGRQDEKYLWLTSHSAAKTTYSRLYPDSPYYFLVPRDETGRSEFASYPSLSEVFPFSVSGMVTSRDEFVIDESPRELEARIRDYVDPSLSDAKVASTFRLSENYAWRITESRRSMKAEGFDAKRIQPVLYRPFDKRCIYYHPAVVWRTRGEAMASLQAPGNVALISVRQVAEGIFNHVFMADCLVESRVTLSNKGIAFCWPLYVPLSGGGAQNELIGGTSANCSRRVAARIASQTGLTYQAGLSGNSLGGSLFGPRDVLDYAYALLHSPSYRTRYSEFLKIDFPRLPLPNSRDLFRAIVDFGIELEALHLMKSDKPGGHHLALYSGPKDPEVVRVGWSNDTVWLDAAATKRGQVAPPGAIGFSGVPIEVWDFHIGGYQVCEKWLKDRKGRRLSKGDIEHYQKIVVAISETIRLMKEIDEVIEQHGGWPGAFQTGTAQAALAEAIAFQPRKVQPRPEERYVTCLPLVPLKIAAGAFSNPQHVDDEEFEWTAVETKRRLRPGMFVAQVVGKSMEPVIPDGAYCVFAAPVEGTRQGKTVLVQLRDATDPETGERYTVKRYESEKVSVGDSWRHAAITLRPANPEFEPIVLEAGDEERLQVVAEFLEVIENRPAPDQDPRSANEVIAAPTREPSLISVEPSRGKSRAAEVAMELAPLFRGPDAPTAVRTIGEVDAAEAMCAIRDLLESPAGRDGIERDDAIRAVARGLGFERTGKNIYETIDSYLIAAARRGIVESLSGRIHLVARSIADYDRGLLKDQFLASLGGYAWTEREEAIRTFARWLGYRRTGAVINDAAKSLINGLLRERRLQSDGETIRRHR